MSVLLASELLKIKMLKNFKFTKFKMLVRLETEISIGIEEALCK